MRIFGSDRIGGLMQRLGMEEGVPIEHNMVSRAIERAQKQVEAQNFSVRKHLLEYDDVMNKQRTVIYAQRLRALEEADLKETMLEMMDEMVSERVHTYLGSRERYDEEDLRRVLNDVSQLLLRPVTLPDQGDRLPSPDEVEEEIQEIFHKAYEEKEQEMSAPILRELERVVYLEVIDEHWMDHLREMDHMREGIGLRAYGQRDPLLEYKTAAFEMFEELTRSIREETVRNLFRAALVLEPVPGRGFPSLAVGPAGASGAPPEMPRILPGRPTAKAAPRQQEVHAEVTAFGTMAEPQEDGGASQRPGGRSAAPPPRPGAAPPGAKQAPVVSTDPKVGRNDPCPCGSGKKYKKCHGAN